MTFYQYSPGRWPKTEERGVEAAVACFHRQGHQVEAVACHQMLALVAAVALSQIQSLRRVAVASLPLDHQEVAVAVLLQMQALVAAAAESHHQIHSLLRPSQRAVPPLAELLSLHPAP